MALATHDAIIDLRPIDPYGRMTPSQELEYFIDRERQLTLFLGFLILLPDDMATQTAEFVKEQIKRASWHIDRARVLVNSEETPSSTAFTLNTWSRIDRERFSKARRAILEHQVRAVAMADHQRLAAATTFVLQRQATGVNTTDHQRSVDTKAATLQDHVDQRSADTKTAILQGQATGVDMHWDNHPAKRSRKRCHEITPDDYHSIPYRRTIPAIQGLGDDVTSELIARMKSMFSLHVKGEAHIMKSRQRVFEIPLKKIPRYVRDSNAERGRRRRKEHYSPYGRHNAPQFMLDSRMDVEDLNEGIGMQEEAKENLEKVVLDILDDSKIPKACKLEDIDRVWLVLRPIGEDVVDVGMSYGLKLDREAEYVGRGIGDCSSTESETSSDDDSDSDDSESEDNEESD